MSLYERAWVECASLVGGDVHLFFTESLVTFGDDLKRARPTRFEAQVAPLLDAWFRAEEPVLWA